MRLNSRLLGAALAAAVVLTLGAVPAHAAVVEATLVAQEGDIPTGADGQPISSLNAPFTDALGNVGFTGGLETILGGTDNFVWFGTGVTWKNSDAVEVLTGAEGTMGISNAGGFIYSPSNSGDDSVYTQNGSLAIEGEAAPDFDAPAVSTFHSRPTMAPDGTAYWIAGIDLDGGASTDGRALYMSAGALPGATTKIVGFGDIVDATPLDLAIDDNSGVDFDYDLSDNGNHAHVLLLETGDLNTDGHVYIDADGTPDGNGSTVAQEATPSGDGDNWDNFDAVSINDSGDYLFSGDTDGDTGSDEFIAYNGSIVLREGDTVGGIALTSSALVNAISINNLGQAAFTWSYDGTETVFFACDASDPAGSSVALLTTGDEVDYDGDGVGDGTVNDFNASGVVGPGLDLGESGTLYVEIDVDDGSGEIEAIIGLELPSCDDGIDLAVGGRCPGDVTLDVTGATPSNQIALLRGTGAGSDVIPAGPCAGTTSGLAGLSLVTIVPSDAGGEFSLTRTLPANLCGVPLQALDVSSCTLSPVVNLP